MVVWLVLLSCHAPSAPPKTAWVTQPSSPPQSAPEDEVSLTELIKQLPFIEKAKRAGMLRAWTLIPNNDHYRIARTSDFANPIMTHDYGEMAGAYGLSTLIVDKTVAGTQRFSLVIFIERPASTYEVYWIYQNMDLSKYRMSRSSGDIMVEEVHDDGTTTACEIQWVKKERRWTCKAP
jgi:hypothetical protein